MIESLRFAQVALVVPFRYTTMIWATLFGFLFFGTVPDSGVIVVQCWCSQAASTS